MSREFKSLIFEKRDRVAYLTLNRPHRLNAFDHPSKFDLQAALGLIVEDPEIRVVAIKGAGRAFSTGVDLKDLSQGKIGPANFRLWEECMREIETMDKVVLCLMHGYALGGGLQLALACDLRIATPSCQMGLPAGQEGLVPGLSVWRLARYVGIGRARELALWGEPVDGEAALRIGLVNRLVSEAGMDAEFEAYVRTTVERASQGMRFTKQAISRAADMTFAEALDMYMDYQARGLESEDLAEAMAAYREKRKPVWR